jgi:phospholipid transport system substrate-binding protein
MSDTMRRRSFLTMILASATLTGHAAFAFSTAQAESLIDKAVADINSIINSGKAENAMLKDFERIFSKYADGNRIGQLVLGADGRSASAGQKSAFSKAFQSYISRKYGRRFREFIGGSVEVKSAKAVKSFYEVKTNATLKGSAPFEVVFVVADDSGRFIDMKIEGISLVKAERAEIGAMLDKRKGNLDLLVADLKNSG